MTLVAIDAVCILVILEGSIELKVLFWLESLSIQFEHFMPVSVEENKSVEEADHDLTEGKTCPEARRTGFHAHSKPVCHRQSH